MAQEFDVTVKALFRGSAKMAVAAIAGDGVWHWLDKELPRVRNTRADLLGATDGGDIVHIEFVSKNDATLGLTMGGYYTEIHLAAKRHPHQVVLYIGRERMRMADRFRTPTFSIRYRLVDIRTLPGEKFLDSDGVGDQILAVLMRLRDQGRAIRRVLTTIAGLPARARQTRLTQLMVLSGLRGLEESVEKEARLVPVLNSVLENKVLGREFKKGLEQGMEQGVKQGFEKGLNQGEARLLKKLLKKQFKVIPGWAADRISRATIEQIEVWGSRVLRAKSLDEIFS